MIIRGRVDHKEAGKVCVIVSEATKFDPSDTEIEKAKKEVARRPPQPCRRAAQAPRQRRRSCPPRVVEDLRDLFERYPGETEFVLEMHTRTGLGA